MSRPPGTDHADGLIVRARHQPVAGRAEGGGPHRPPVAGEYPAGVPVARSQRRTDASREPDANKPDRRETPHPRTHSVWPSSIRTGSRVDRVPDPQRAVRSPGGEDVAIDRAAPDAAVMAAGRRSRRAARQRPGTDDAVAARRDRAVVVDEADARDPPVVRRRGARSATARGSPTLLASG